MPTPPILTEHPIPTLPLEKTSHSIIHNSHFLSVKYPTLPGWWLNLTHTPIHRWFYACPSSKRFYPLTPALYTWALHPQGRPPGEGISFHSAAFAEVMSQLHSRPSAVVHGRAFYGRSEPMKVTLSAPVARQIVQPMQQTLTPPETPSPPRQTSGVPASTIDHAAVEAYLRDLAARVWPRNPHVQVQMGAVVPDSETPATDEFDWDAEFAKYGS